MYHTEVETPRYDGGTGRCLYGDGKGNFHAMTVHESGIYISKDVKDIDPLVINNQSEFIVTNNNDLPQIIIENKYDIVYVLVHSRSRNEQS